MSKMEEGEGQEGEEQKWESEEFEMEAGGGILVWSTLEEIKLQWEWQMNVNKGLPP